MCTSPEIIELFIYTKNYRIIYLLTNTNQRISYKISFLIYYINIINFNQVSVYYAKQQQAVNQSASSNQLSLLKDTCKCGTSATVTCRVSASSCEWVSIYNASDFYAFENAHPFYLKLLELVLINLIIYVQLIF